MMKKTTLALFMPVFVASSCFSAFSWAEGPQGKPSQQQWQQGHGVQSGPGSHGHGHEGGPVRPGSERDHFAWNGHDFRGGHPVPERFRGDDFRVYDWHARVLQAPPPGEHWAYIYGNYVLIATTTGILRSIIMSTMLPH